MGYSFERTAKRTMLACLVIAVVAVVISIFGL